MADEVKRSDDDQPGLERAEGDAPEGAEDAQSGAEAVAAEEPKNRRGRRAAASQARKQRLRERQEAEAVGLDAQEMIDDALVRSKETTTKWLKRNSTILQGIAVGAVVIWAGWGIYGWRLKAAQAESSTKVAAAVSAERGRVGEPTPDDESDPRPLFKDNAARIAAAKSAFEIAAKERGGAAAYSQLALAAVLLDEGKIDEARAAYEALQSHKLASSDPELRGRALEGVALTFDAKGDKQAALKAYTQLEESAITGFVELATYRKARIHQALKQDDQAKALAEKLNAKLKESNPGPGSYLAQLAKGLSEELGIATPEPPDPRQITPEQLQELQRAMQESIGKMKPGKDTQPLPAEEGDEKAPAPPAEPSEDPK